PHSRATREGQRSLPQIPVAAAGTTPRLARALAHDDARTTPPLGHRARGQAGSDASARAAKSLSVRRGVTVVNAGARREILNGALQNVKQDINRTFPERLFPPISIHEHRPVFHRRLRADA